MWKLSYSITQDFSTKQTMLGLSFLFFTFTATAIMVVLINGKVYHCDKVEFCPQFNQSICTPKLLEAGTTIEKTDVVFEIKNTVNYSGEKLKCNVTETDLMMYGISIFTPLMLWNYNINCGFVNLSVKAVNEKYGYSIGNVIATYLPLILDSSRPMVDCKKQTTPTLVAARIMDGVMDNGTVFYKTGRRYTAMSCCQDNYTVGYDKIQAAVEKILLENLNGKMIETFFRCQNCREIWDKPWKILVSVATSLSAIVTVAYSGTILVLKWWSDRKARD